MRRLCPELAREHCFFWQTIGLTFWQLKRQLRMKLRGELAAAVYVNMTDQRQL